MENNNSFSEDKEQKSSTGYWSTPEQVAQAAESVVEPAVEAEAPVVEAPVAEAVVEAPAAEEPVQSLGFTKTGAIGSMAADGKQKNIKPENQNGDKVAIYSTSNVRWEEASGAIYKGVNIVTKDQADKWLTRSHVRLATPEEVQKSLG
jgi:hypothetical protein